jgi:predicted transcriptional regulator of viral defense system
MVPDQMWRKDPRTGRRQTSGADLEVWCALCFLARERGFVDSTDEAIADECGIAARTVRDSLARLERRGFLERSKGEDGRRRLVLRPEGQGGEPYPLGVIG